ncbi:MAG: hypothetical protein Q9165_001679 [Trypethelium subeluteriae]
MVDDEVFTLVSGGSGRNRLFDEYEDLTSAKMADLDIQITSYLRSQNPELIVTTVPSYNVGLLAFAYAGHATAEIDTKTESIARWRGYNPPVTRGGSGGGGPGQLAEAIFFAKYHYKWNEEDFILYTVGSGNNQLQYILKEPRHGEDQLSHSSVTDSLVRAVGTWQYDIKGIWVYDRFWRLDPQLYERVKDASWDDVILDPSMKKDLTEVSENFFDSKDVYDDLGVPWKRGLIFYGPAGNGKTISIKALMHTLSTHNPPIPTLYVKAAPSTFDVRNVFVKARQLAPCMLILEDIDTIVTPTTRSYFFNEVDGLEKNDGILMVASTNHIERLDPGLSKRPSRFDRKYLFPLPSKSERTEYCEYWRRKLRRKPSVIFPSKLCPAIASITHGFSFAYIQEAFVAALLQIARGLTDYASKRTSAVSSDSENDDRDDDGLEQYELWRVIKHQVKILRDDMDKSPSESAHRPPRNKSIHLPSAYPETGHERISQRYHHTHVSSPSLPGVASPNSGDLAAAAGLASKSDMGINRQPQLGWLAQRFAPPHMPPQDQPGPAGSMNVAVTGNMESNAEGHPEPLLQGPYGPVQKRPFMNSAATDWRWAGY